MCIRDRLYPEDLPPRYRQSGAEVSACQVTVHGIMPLKEAIQQVESQLLCHAQEKYTTTREIAKVLGVDPVSYTHLDVYKRQEWGWSARRQPRSRRGCT